MNELEKKVYESFLSCINLMLKPHITVGKEELRVIKPDNDTLNSLNGSLLSFTQAFATKVNAEKSIK